MSRFEYEGQEACDRCMYHLAGVRNCPYCGEPRCPVCGCLCPETAEWDDDFDDDVDDDDVDDGYCEACGEPIDECIRLRTAMGDFD